MARNYRELVRIATKGVRTLARGLGEAFVGVLHGVMSDLVAQGATEAITSAWMTHPEQPDDALALIGAERKLPAYPGETMASYRARNLGAWAAYEVAGDEDSIIGQLAAAGFPGVVIYDPWNFAIPPPAGYSAPYYSQFVVWFPIGSHPITSAGPAIGSFVVGDGTILGPIGLTATLAATWRGIIGKWKPAQWICRWMAFQLTGWAIGDGHLVGEPGLLIGGTVVTMGA